MICVSYNSSHAHSPWINHKNGLHRFPLATLQTSIGFESHNKEVLSVIHLVQASLLQIFSHSPGVIELPVRYKVGNLASVFLINLIPTTGYYNILILSPQDIYSILFVIMFFS